MSNLPQNVKDHFRNLGRQHGRQLAERERQGSQAGKPVEFHK